MINKEQKGVDGFNRPTYEYERKSVQNVLIAPVSAQESIETLNLTGKKAQYQLAIPKTDTNKWEDSYVLFFGQSFRTIGPVSMGVDALVPLDWNKKIYVELMNKQAAEELREII